MAIVFEGPVPRTADWTRLELFRTGLQSWSLALRGKFSLVLKFLKKQKDWTLYNQMVGSIYLPFLAISTNIFIFLAILLDFIQHISGWSL